MYHKRSQEIANVKNWLDTLDKPCAAVTLKDKMCPAPKATIKDDDMYVEQAVTVTEKTEETARRKHFLSRADDIAFAKKQAAQLHFHIEIVGPTTNQEVIEFIKAGKFTLEDTYADEKRWAFFDRIEWTTGKRDEKGYKVAKEKLGKLLTSTQDAIWAETDFSKIPALLAKFEEKTIH